MRLDLPKSKVFGDIIGCSARPMPILNLTRIHNFENMVLKHYVDSLLVLKYVELPEPLIDMGSGPGLARDPAEDRPAGGADDPGRAARCAGGLPSRGLRSDSGLERHRSLRPQGRPGLSRSRSAGVISRAVGPIPETLDRVASCLEPGGRMIFMKGPDCDLEVAEAARVARRVSSGWRPITLIRFPARPTTAGWSSSSGWRERRADDFRQPTAIRGAVRVRWPDPGDHQRRQPDLPAMPRHPGRPGYPQARRGDPGRCPHPRRGPGAVPRACAGLVDRPGRPAAARGFDRVASVQRTLFKQLDVVGTHDPLLLVRVPEIALVGRLSPGRAVHASSCRFRIPKMSER